MLLLFAAAVVVVVVVVIRGVRNIIDQFLIIPHRRHQIERIGPYAVRQQCFRGEYFGRDIVEGIPIFIVAFEPEQIGVLLPADIELREPIHP